MEIFLTTVAQLLGRVIKLVLLAWVGLLALSVLLVVLGAVALNVLWSLLRGRKPALFTTYTRFRQASQQFRAGGWSRPGGFAQPVQGDVVDVQVNEVPDQALPAPRGLDKS